MHFTGSNVNHLLFVGTSHHLCVCGRYLTCILNVQVPSENILRAGKVLRTAILSRAPHMIRDRKYHLKTYRLVGILILELIFAEDRIIQFSSI